MGSYSSGRYRTRNRGAVGDTCRLELKWVRRLGFVQPGSRCSGLWAWSRGGERVASINLTVDLIDPDNGQVELQFTHDGESRKQTVYLVARSCRYGGRRYYFLCPQTGQRCEVLCCVRGYFASRQYHRLAYDSQSEDVWNRMLRARNKVQARLEGTDNRPRPRGANRERLFNRWCDLEEGLDQRLAIFAGRLMSKYGEPFEL